MTELEPSGSWSATTPTKTGPVTGGVHTHGQTHHARSYRPGVFAHNLVHPAPVLVDNDVNLAALAEHRAGNAAGRLASPYVYVGAGRGLGLYIGDQLIRGAHGLAGEIGFLPASTALTSPATKRHKRRLV